MLDRVTAAGIELFGTMTHGTISIRTDGVGWDLSYTGRDGAPDASGTDLQSAHDTYGCIDINSASAASLTGIIQIGEARAAAIKEIRAIEPFTTLDKLEQIRGIGSATVEAMREQGLACVE